MCGSVRMRVLSRGRRKISGRRIRGRLRRVHATEKLLLEQGWLGVDLRPGSGKCPRYPALARALGVGGRGGRFALSIGGKRFAFLSNVSRVREVLPLLLVMGVRVMMRPPSSAATAALFAC